MQSISGNMASPSRNRRIKPTQLTSASTMSPLNPSFIPTSNNQSNMPSLNRPVQMTAAWKKIQPAQVQPIKISQSQENSLKARLQSALRTCSNELDALALAGHEMLFSSCLDEANRFQLNFSSALAALLKILHIGHEMLMKSDDDTHWDYLNTSLNSNLNESTLLDTPLQVLQLAVNVIKHSSGSLCVLFPDSIRFLAKNTVIEAAGIPFPTHLLAKSTSSSLAALPSSSQPASRENDPLAVAYSNTRDSRNFFTDPTAHANQQRIRDLFSNLIRQYGGLDCGQASFRRGFGGRVSEIVGRLMMSSNSDSNSSHTWLADLFLTEYMQAAETRIDSLEERLGRAR